MPSPFPGMDPYLEQNDWMAVHVHFSVEIARHLTPLIQPKYFVLAEKVYLLDSGPEASAGAPPRRRPDVSIGVANPLATAPSFAPTSFGSPLVMDVAIPDSQPQMTVEIFDVENRSLVTAIEVLSQTNKRGTGRVEYLAKRGQVLRSDASLVELDLVRAGVKMPMARPMPSSPYSVVVSRAGRRPSAEVWPILLRDPLPTIPVPLRTGDADAPLDLQKVLDTMYDAFRLDLHVRYDRPLDPPMDADDARWTDEMIDRWRGVRR